MKKYLFTMGILVCFGQMFGQLMIDEVSVIQPTCSDPCNGEIVINTVGGTGLIQYSIDYYFSIAGIGTSWLDDDNFIYH